MTATYVWTAAGKNGTLVRAACSKSSVQVAELDKGTPLTVEEEKAAEDGTPRLRISSPVEGWISKKLARRRVATEAPDPLSFGLRVPPHGPGAPPRRQTRPDPPLWPPRSRAGHRDLDALMARAAAPGVTGDIYGLPLPRTPDEVLKFGAAWLTRCFHAAGTLDEGINVTEIVKAEELQVHKGADCAGGAGRKMFLTVKYDSPDLANLRTELFLKLPWEPSFHMRAELSVGLGDGDGLEIATYQYLERLLPCHIPKYFFGDIDRASTNYVLITERIPYAERGVDPADLPPGAVHAACGKYEDFRLASPERYYAALFRCMGRIAACDKRGRFDKHADIFDQMHMEQRVAMLSDGRWKPPGGVVASQARLASQRAALAEAVDSGIAFAADVATVLCEPEVLEPSFLARFREELLDALAYNAVVAKFGSSDSNYVALTHVNLQLDNAYFWTTKHGGLECGLLDWYMCSRANLPQIFLGCLSGAEGKLLAERDLEIFGTFADAYQSHGGPRVSPEDLRERFMLHFPAYVISNISRIKTHILPEVPIEAWAAYTSREDVFAGPWNARCYSVMIANALSYWYHKGDDHPGAVAKRWADKHGLRFE